MEDRVMHILIADDQPHVRSALRLLLTQKAGVSEVDEAASMQHVRSATSAKQPDLILLDWKLVGQTAASQIAHLRSLRAGLVVIALSGRPEAQHMSLTAGADAFISKGDPPEQLLALLGECSPAVR
jgi:DNA-binding response OmpR family regulator